MDWERELSERKASNKGVILIGSALFNWSETQRMTGFGEELYRRGYYIVYVGSGKYDYLVQERPFERRYIEADEWWFTKERIEKMMDIGKYGNQYATVKEIEEIVSQEIALINEIKPLAMITGYRNTFSISARATHTPLVWCLSAVVSPMYFEQNLANIPEQQMLYIQTFMKNIKTEEKKQEFYKKLTQQYVLSRNRTSQEWNKYLKRHNLPLLQSDLDMFKGDLNIMSDAKELFPLISEELSNYKFCGPIISKETIPMPECVKNHVKKEDRKVVFVVMGSSGEKTIFKETLKCIENTSYDIFVATVGIIDKDDEKEFPDNFYFAEKYPLIEMMKYADAAIIHGGQGTVYSTILGGKPFIGIPMFNEQQYNLENLNRKAKCGIVLLKSQVTKESIGQSLHEILTCKEYRENMELVSNEISKYYDNELYNANIIAANDIESLVTDMQ